MWNLMVDAVNGLLQSSQTSGIKIASISPAGTASEPLRIGTVLQITGQSFGYSVGQARVSFEGSFGSVAIPFGQLLAGSSDTRLLLLMPSLPGITQTGMTVTLRVSNGVADDLRSVLVMPVILALMGDVFVTSRASVPPVAVSNPNPNPLQPGQAATFAYQLQTATNMPATFTLSADIINSSAALPGDLIGSIRFLNEVAGVAGLGPGGDIPNKTVELGKEETRNIYVRIPQLPTNFADVSFTLRVTSTSAGAAAGGVTGSDSHSYTVGAVVTPPDPNITLQQTGNFVLNPATGDVDSSLGSLAGDTIQLKAGAMMVMQFNVRFMQSGTYDITVQPRSGSTMNGWTLQLLQTAATITTSTNDETRFVQFGVTSSANAAASGAVVFRIKRQGAENERTKEYAIQLM
jgi:hypothetical protein